MVQSRSARRFEKRIRNLLSFGYIVWGIARGSCKDYLVTLTDSVSGQRGTTANYVWGASVCRSPDKYWARNPDLLWKRKEREEPTPEPRAAGVIACGWCHQYHRWSPAKHSTAVHHQSRQHKIKDNQPATLRTQVSIHAGFAGFARVIKLPKTCPGV